MVERGCASLVSAQRYHAKDLPDRLHDPLALLRVHHNHTLVPQKCVLFFGELRVAMITYHRHAIFPSAHLGQKLLLRVERRIQLSILFTHYDKLLWNLIEIGTTEARDVAWQKVTH